MTGATNAQLSSRAGLGTSNQTEPPAVDVERQPMPDTASETTSDTSTQPPARSGPAAQAPEQPAFAASDGDPTHHAERIPPEVTLDRERGHSALDPSEPNVKKNLRR